MSLAKYAGPFTEPSLGLPGEAFTYFKPAPIISWLVAFISLKPGIFTALPFQCSHSLGSFIAFMSASFNPNLRTISSLKFTPKLSPVPFIV